jgi:hypothetical protein
MTGKGRGDAREWNGEHMTVIWIVIVLVVAAVCAGAGYFARKHLGEAKIASAEKAAE